MYSKESFIVIICYTNEVIFFSINGYIYKGFEILPIDLNLHETGLSKRRS